MPKKSEFLDAYAAGQKSVGRWPYSIAVGAVLGVILSRIIEGRYALSHSKSFAISVVIVVFLGGVFGFVEPRFRKEEEN